MFKMSRAEKKAQKAAEALALIAPAAEQVEQQIMEMVSASAELPEVVIPETPAPEATPEQHAELVEETVERLEAIEGGSGETPAPVGEPVSEPAPIGEPANANDFDTALASVSAEDVDAKLVAIVAAIDERCSFEMVKDPTNKNIAGTLKKARGEVCTKRAARLMCVTSIDPEVFNRTIHQGARYNVYAIGKFADAVKGLTDGTVKNAINLACMKSLFRFRAAGVQFTGELAKAAASDKIRVDRAIKDHLVSHTVSASTAPTQASSTMQALETLGIVRRSGSGKNPNFDLTGNPIVAKLEKVLAA